MFFLNSIAFWGTAGAIGVATPIIIHLLNRRKFERVQWAAMRFIQQAIQQNQRRIQVEDLILLIIRCLIIALIALALARPTVSGNLPSLGESTSAVIILDCSGSMSAHEGTETRFAQAKKVAEQMLGELPPKSDVSLVLVSDSIPSLIPDPSPDHGAISKEILHAQLTDRGSNIVPAIKKSLEILSKTSTTRKEIITISDKQRLGWRQTAEIQKLFDENRKDVHATLVFVGEMPTQNLAITNLRLDSEIPAANRQLRFMAEIRNFGTTAVEGGATEVSLFVDGEETKAIVARGESNSRTAAKVSAGKIGPGETQSVLLTTRIEKEGYHTVTAKLPDDPIPSGNSRSVAFHVVKQVQVLVVDGEPSPEPRDSKSFYLSHALKTDPYIQTDVQNVTEFAAQRNLQDYDVIILANVVDLPTTSLPSLERFVKNGGGLAVFPGANANVKFYNEQLFANRNLIPAGLGDTAGEADNESKFFTFQTGNYSHPIVSMWSKPERGNPTVARFFKVWNLVPPKQRDKNALAESLTGETRLVMSYNNGNPAIMERTLGTGRTVIFSSGADTKWNDLAVASSGKIFVPLVMHTVGSLVGREDELFNVRAGQRLSVPQPSERIGQDVTISLQGDDKYPVQSSRVEITNGIGTFRFDNTNRAGVYNAVIGTGSSAETLKFAVSPDTEESSLDPIVAAQTSEFEKAGVKVLNWSADMAFGDTFKRVQQGTEIWIYFALPALLLAAVETYLAHVFSKQK